MSTFTVDKNGNRIKTDILIYGYLRQEIEKLYKILIPSEIKQLCFEYWFINICDEWDIKLCKHKSIEFNGQTVRCIDPVSPRNIYGCHCVSSGEFVWKLNLKKVGIKGIIIGIVEHDQCEKYLDDGYYVAGGYGACWYSKNGILYDSSRKFKKFANDFKDVMIENVYVEIKIDMNETSLYFAIDGDEFKKAPYALKKDASYRLAVSFYQNEDIDECQLM